jgi:hypothetical protein
MNKSSRSCSSSLAQLKTMLSSVLTSPFRECILWGEDQLVLYNDEVSGRNLSLVAAWLTPLGSTSPRRVASIRISSVHQRL